MCVRAKGSVGCITALSHFCAFCTRRRIHINLHQGVRASACVQKEATGRVERDACKQLSRRCVQQRRSLQGGLPGLRPGVQAGLQATDGWIGFSLVDGLMHLSRSLGRGESGACVLISKARGRGAYFM